MVPLCRRIEGRSRVGGERSPLKNSSTMVLRLHRPVCLMDEVRIETVLLSLR